MGSNASYSLALRDAWEIMRYTVLLGPHFALREAWEIMRYTVLV